MRAAGSTHDKPAAQPFPWKEAMAFGLGILRLPPRDFWAMTLPELTAAARGALGLEPGAMPFDKESLLGLMGRFPDKAELF